MPHCPNCKEEYREGYDRCKDCGALLEEAAPAVSQTEGTAFLPILPDEALVPVTPVSTILEIAPVKGLLQSAGIPVVERAEGAGPIVKAVTGTAFVRLWVPERLEAEAKELLEAYGQSADPADDIEEDAEAVPFTPGANRSRHLIRAVGAVILIGVALLFLFARWPV